ncbi:hypothetical protein SADUNF_Sadunf10G0072000 [Salix dunnii]|uniref:Uncharacterized protein n=1 Tax=Salix dunnii TaxID=1413687 RepID=A0A835JVC3_9ROSI|nr:hypothetical protein SADUNF_Sadunf10G0072000 [Salix dunnii]
MWEDTKSFNGTNKEEGDYIITNRDEGEDIPRMYLMFYGRPLLPGKFFHCIEALGRRTYSLVLHNLYISMGTTSLSGYSWRKSRNKTTEIKANLIMAAAAGAYTVTLTQHPLKMQTGEFGKSNGLWKTLSEGTWSEAFNGFHVRCFRSHLQIIELMRRGPGLWNRLGIWLRQAEM